MTLSLHEGARAAGRLTPSLLLSLELDKHFKLLHVPVAGFDMHVGMMCTSFQLCLNMGLLLQAHLSICLQVLLESN